PGRRHRFVRRQRRQRDDRAPVFDGPDGRGPLACGRRQLRARARIGERVRQRRIAAPRRAGCQSSGGDHGERRPQRPPPGGVPLMITMREAPDATVLTGAAGWLGSGVMEALTADRSAWARAGTIRALVTNRAEGARLEALSPSVEPVIGDLTDAP